MTSRVASWRLESSHEPAKIAVLVTLMAMIPDERLEVVEFAEQLFFLPDGLQHAEECLSIALAHLLIARVGINGRRQRRHVPRKPLCQEQIPRLPVDRCYRRVAQAVKRIQPIELGSLLPGPPRELHAAL